MPADLGTIEAKIKVVLEEQYTSFVKREPVILGGLALGATNAVLTELVTHGVITNTQASGATQSVTGLAAAGLTVAASFLVRRFVSPAWKKLTGDQLPDVAPAAPEPPPAAPPAAPPV